jgi:hypothetical protein
MFETPDVAGSFNDTIVDAPHGTFQGACRGFVTPNPKTKGGHPWNVTPGVYTGDYNLIVFNSTGSGKCWPGGPGAAKNDCAAQSFCGGSL